MNRWGLIGAGSVSRSFLLDMPGLSRRLGPVLSTSVRLASRIANSLKAGFPVRTVQPFEQTDTILICCPEGNLARMTRPLIDSRLDLSEKTVLIFASGMFSVECAEVQMRGASLASVDRIDADWFVVEGDRAALKEAKSIVKLLQGRAVEISPKKMELFRAGITLSGGLFTPLLETCTESFRQSGVDGATALKLTERLFLRAVRAFMHSGRKSWPAMIARADRSSVERQQLALGRAKPLMGTYFGEAARFAFELYRTFPELTRYNRERWKVGKP